MNKHDWNSIEWATRNHPKLIHYRATDDAGVNPSDGLQRVQAHKGRLVNPQKSHSTGGTVVKGRSRKGKFQRTNFLSTGGKSDARMEPAAPPKPVLHTGFAISYQHDGNRRLGKKVPLRDRLS